jgi:hypothetical protein
MARATASTRKGVSSKRGSVSGSVSRGAGSKGGRGLTLSRKPADKSKCVSAGRSGSAGVNRAYMAVAQQLSAKVDSYRVLLGQVKGSAKNRPDVTSVNRMAGLVARGAQVYSVAGPKVSESIGSAKKSPSSAVVLRSLRSRYGAQAIKAVAPGVGGRWLVAAASMVGGKAFRPKW